ncbi:MAG: glycosyltransferase family 1 protein [Zetaproteobacteria bacterium]|nr:MAG: glycosyltransferase family 1 protein [Zetaproteobacteria bacterium]
MPPAGGDRGGMYAERHGADRRGGTSLLYLASHIRPARTGGERYNLHLLAAAAAAGVRVCECAYSDHPLYRWLAQRCGLWRLCRPFAFLWMQFQIVRHRRRVLLFDAWTAPLVWPGVRLVRGRYLVIAHHLIGDMAEGALRRAWGMAAERGLLRGAAAVLTVSRASRAQILQRTGGRGCVDVIHPAFTPVEGRTRGGGGCVRLLFVGHFTRAKGVEELLQAASGLPRDRPWVVELAGRDDVEPATTARLRQMRRASGLEERVVLHGRLDDAALRERYLCSDIFVLPSHREGYGIVLLEAMACGLAVVATTAGAIPEVVEDGVRGLLVPPGDVAALRDAMARLIEDERLRAALARAGEAFARAHPDWAGMERQCVAWWRSRLPLPAG